MNIGFDASLERALGATGLRVSPLGLGTVKFGRNQGVKYPRGFALPTDPELDRLLGTAEALGISLLDTAPAYGSSEERLGRLLHGRRERWRICTKVGEDFEDGRSHFDFSPAGLRASVERSLRRLKVEALDLVLLHSDGRDVEHIEQDGALEVLADLKSNGLVRATGISSKTVAGGVLGLQHSDVAMVTLNLAEQTDLPVIAWAAAHDKGILIKKGLASGHAAQPMSGTALCESVGNIHRNNDALCESGAEGDRDPILESFRLIFSQRGVSSVIVGTLNPAHLQQNTEKLVRVLKLLSSGVSSSG